jgi:PAS domain S-box-containing protein
MLIEEFSQRGREEELLRHTAELIVELNSDGRIAYISSPVERILGRPPSFFADLGFSDLVIPADRKSTLATFRKIIDTGAEPLFRFRCDHRDGQQVAFEASARSFMDSEDRQRVVVVCRDLTERSLRGAVERMRDAYHRAIAESGTRPAIITTLDGDIQFSNRRFRELFGHCANLRDLQERMSAASRAAMETSWYHTRQNEDSKFGSADFEVTCTDDTTAWFSTTWEAILPEDPTRQFSMLFQDISERRKAQEALRQSESKLAQAQKMEAVGRLAGGIAHDFNNLLTAIIGYSDLVLDQLGEDLDSKSDVEEILRAAERAGGLTRQLLAFSRRQVLQPEAVDLNRIVADIDRMMRRLIGENIELVTSQDGELHRIIADPGQIEQVIVNLVVNARDAMPMGGRIEIETANFHVPRQRPTDSGKLAAGDYVLLRVSDTGVGMEPEVRSQIFEPFFTTKEAHEGTGLGLASAYGIVSQTGGQIDVESALERGTTFSVYLPAAREETRGMEQDAEAFDVGGTETILVVEDSEPVRKLVARALESSGYKVLVAESATAALRHCSRHEGPIDLLLSDVVLPKTSGPEIAKRALELRPEIRVLFMSGFTDDTLIRQGIQPGRLALLEKPFSPATVLSRVRRALDEDPEAISDSTFPVEHS